ncbi:hypothetical protein, partial [Parvimonas sp. M13]|uniref:hypothetical protein n=1 Tax=Parvimonas sp. M13 TaxID=3110694 RepID=UPI002B485FF5
LPKNGSVDVVFDNRVTQIDLPADHKADFSFSNFAYDNSSKRFQADLLSDGAGGAFSVPVLGHVTVKRRIPVLAHRVEGGSTLAAS